MNSIKKRYALLKNATILIVEDDKSELEKMSELFETYCKKCYTAKDGKEGYEKYLLYRPDVILSDYKLPVVNGLKMIENIRKVDNKIPFILLTIYNDNQLFLKAIEHKVSAYLSKPAGSALLLDTILKEYEGILKDRKLDNRNRLMQAILEEFPQKIMVIDIKGNVLFGNNAIKKDKFWEEKNSQKCYEVIYGCSVACKMKGLPCDNEKAIKTGKPQESIHQVYDLDNKKIYTSIKTIPITDRENKVYVFLKIIEDKRQEINEQERLMQLANYDSLTGLPNRILLLDRLRQAILRSKRKKSFFVIMFIDLDGFKGINDIYGHENGDNLLQMVSKRIKKSVRKVDTVARYGGDEFIVILEDMNEKRGIEEIAKSILDNLNKEFELANGIKVNISCSIGIEFFDPMKDKITEDIIIKNADKAMYEVKKNGKNGYKFYNLN